MNQEEAFENIRSYLIEQWEELDEDDRPEDSNDYVIDRLDDFVQEMWDERTADNPDPSELVYSCGVYLELLPKP